jgi:hypothetical protein
MDKYSTTELKQAYTALYNTSCDKIWRDINTELARRLGKDEYKKFVEHSRIQARLQVD